MSLWLLQGGTVVIGTAGVELTSGTCVVVPKIG